MTRKEILDAAAEIVTKDRNERYGEPEQSFEVIADFWATYLNACSKGGPIEFPDAHDVAVMMALMKIARIATGKAKPDNWIDLAGYAACGGEVQEAE